MSSPHASLFEKLSKRIELAQTISGTITTTTTSEHIHERETIRFAYRRPNLSRVETWKNGSLVGLTICDGRKTWTEDDTMAAIYTTPAPVDGFPKAALLAELMGPTSDLEPFFLASRQEVHSGAITSFARRRKKTSYSVEMTRGFPVPRREVFSALGRTSIMQCDSVHLDESIPAATFTLKPSVPVDPQDVSTLLLPIGAHAPDFSATMTDGSKFQMSSFSKGAKATVVQFWHLCVPCESQLFAVLSLQRQYADQGLRVVSVFTGITESSCKGVLSMKGLTNPIVLGVTANPNIDAAYRDCSSPTAYILDSQGVVRFRYAGDYHEMIAKDLQTFGIGSARPH